jgi:hypothetical protein
MAWQTHHKLERIEISYRLADPVRGIRATLTAHGTTATKRGYLWTHSEAWGPDEMHEAGYEPSDLARHLILVCEQDRPNSAQRLAFGLTGGLSWDEPGLFDS